MLNSNIIIILVLISGFPLNEPCIYLVYIHTYNTLIYFEVVFVIL